MERRFAELREYFRGRGANSFDLQSLEDELADLARRGKKTTYGKLCRRYAISRGGGPKGIGDVLDLIDERVRDSRVRCTHPLHHHVSAVVVLANTEYPSGGFFGIDDLPTSLARSERQWTNPTLSQKEKDFIEEVWQHLQSCRV